MSSFPPPSVPGDPLLDRLERLAQRRTLNAGPAAATRAPVASKRHHPAHGARVGALVMSCATVAGLTYLFADINSSQAADQAIAALPQPVAVVASPQTAVAATPSTSSPAAVTTTPAPVTTATSVAPVPAAAATQAFNGDVIDTRYGPVQVQVQITNGAVAEVAVVEYPNGDGKSVRINARALPTLRTEALSAQSAQVDTVSGATYTSDAYARSLQSAIDQARAAGATALA